MSNTSSQHAIQIGTEGSRPSLHHEAIYVVEFGNGTLKVGRSGDPKRRVKNHEYLARRKGTEVSRAWTSGWHLAARNNETALIYHCHSYEGSKVTGREWFTGVDYASVVDYAESLVKEPDFDTAGPEGCLSLWGGRSKRLVEMKGGAMSPTLEEGETLVVVPTLRGFEFDGIFMFILEDQEFIRRVQRIPGKGVNVIADNKMHASFFIRRDDLNKVDVVGYVDGRITFTAMN